MSTPGNRTVLVLRCPEQRGIVAGVTTLLSDCYCTIEESSQYCDASTQTFFMRVMFHPEQGGEASIAEFRNRFTGLAVRLSIEWELHDLAHRPKVVLMVSKFGHCLHDLINRWSAGLLRVEIVAVVSNHETMRQFVEFHGLEFIHLPVTPETKPVQEARLIELIEARRADLVVLARYMQVLSEDLCRHLDRRCINIHHSFLPSFKGAKPYHQAHAKGVKMIGATAHFVTTDLDEGPIIHQDTRAVDHTFTPELLVALGQEIESSVLTRAVMWFAEHRIIGNGAKTVVFR